MDPIGASDLGVARLPQFLLEIDGMRMLSVPGGTHWGGGLFVSALRLHGPLRLSALPQPGRLERHARVLSQRWIELLDPPRPAPSSRRYGFLWWLNTGRSQYPNVPESSFFARGAGSNVIWIDQDLGLTAVIRWIDQKKIGDFLGRVVASLT